LKKGFTFVNTVKPLINLMALCGKLLLSRGTALTWWGEAGRVAVAHYL